MNIMGRTMTIQGEEESKLRRRNSSNRRRSLWAPLQRGTWILRAVACRVSFKERLLWVQKAELSRCRNRMLSSKYRGRAQLEAILSNCPRNSRVWTGRLILLRRRRSENWLKPERGREDMKKGRNINKQLIDSLNEEIQDRGRDH